MNRTGTPRGAGYRPVRPVVEAVEKVWKFDNIAISVGGKRVGTRDVVFQIAKQLTGRW